MKEKLTQQEYQKIIELVDNAIYAPNKKEAQKYITQIQSYRYNLCGNADNILSELISYTKSASGRVTDKQHWIGCVENKLYVLKGYGVEKWIYNSNDDDLQDENSKLRALISNNFGRRKNDPAKDRKALETYVELRGYKQHDNQWTCHNGTTTKSTLDEIAKELNMSKRNLQRALRIERNLTDSMKELLDTGEITKTFASDTNIYHFLLDISLSLVILSDRTKQAKNKEIFAFISP